MRSARPREYVGPLGDSPEAIVERDRRLTPMPPTVLAGTIEADGARWPRNVRLTLDGARYFELEIRTLRVLLRLDEPLLAGPR
jgi:hypothetical protein